MEGLHATVKNFRRSRVGRHLRHNDAGIAKRQTASMYLKELCDIGVLQEEKGGREKVFIHPNLMKLLTAEDRCRSVSRMSQERGRY